MPRICMKAEYTTMIFGYEAHSQHRHFAVNVLQLILAHLSLQNQIEENTAHFYGLNGLENSRTYVCVLVIDV